MEACITIAPAEAERFARICRGIVMHGRREAGIGTLSERTMHAAVKCFLSSDPATQEVAFAPYVADIMQSDGHIFEIQTQGFGRLKGKLDLFLQTNDVTVVYPYPLIRYTVTLSSDGQVLTERRKSPRPGRVLAVFDELYRIKSFLLHPRLKVRLLFLEVTDYRMQQAPSARKRGRGSTRVERMPAALLGDISPTCPADWAALLPEGLPQTFSSAEVAAAARVRRPYAQSALNVLAHLGAVRTVGKQGNTILYQRTEPSGDCCKSI